MADIKLGEIISCDARRDAIHVAIAPVVAGHTLTPGLHVGCRSDGRYGDVKTPIGIVDPFLKGNVQPGERFWLFLYQGTVTSLRHEWAHPSFGEERVESHEAATVWLTEFSENLGMSYEDLMGAALAYLRCGDYTTQNGSDSWRTAFNGNEVEFWTNYEIVTDTRVKDGSARFFSCSC